MTDKEVIKIAQGLLTDFKAESDTMVEFCNAIIKTFEQKQKAVVWHDFYPEDPETWPPADKELLVKNHVGDNFIAYLELDDSEDGGWGFYSEDGDFMADGDEVAAWMPISQYERDKDYIPVQEREKKTIPAETHEDAEEEKDRWGRRDETV